MLEEVVRCSEEKMFWDVVAPSEAVVAVSSDASGAGVGSIHMCWFPVSNMIHVDARVCLLQKEDHQFKIVEA